MPEDTPSRLARIETKIDNWGTTHADHVKQDGEAFGRIEKSLSISRDWLRSIVAPLIVAIVMITVNRIWPPQTAPAQAATTQKP